jgi:hypothetical protein
VNTDYKLKYIILGLIKSVSGDILFLTIFTTSVLFLKCGISCADDFKWDAKVRATEEYSDNLYSSVRDKESDWATVVFSKGSVSNDTERLKFGLSGDVSWKMYANTHDLNHVDWDVGNGISWLADERMSLSSNLSASESSSIERYLSETGTLLDNPKTRTQRWNGSVNRMLLERLTGFVSVDVGHSTLSTADWNGNDYTLNSVGGSTGLTYQVDEWTKLNGVLSYGNYDYDTSKVRQFDAVLGVERALSERVSFSLNAGSSFSSFIYDKMVGLEIVNSAIVPVYAEDTIRSREFTGTATMTYRDDDNTLSLSAFQKEQPSVSNGRSLTVTSASVAYGRRVDEKLSVRVSGSYWYNRNDDPDLARPIKTRTWVVSPGIDYKIGENVLLQGIYSFTEYREKPDNVRRNVARVVCEYSY